MDEEDYTDQPDAAQRPHRSGCLSSFLIVVIALNLIEVTIISFSVRALMARTRFPLWVITTAVMLSLINALSAYGIYKWRRIGVHGVVLCTLFSIILQIWIGYAPSAALLNLVCPAILIFLVLPVWRFMK